MKRFLYILCSIVLVVAIAYFSLGIFGLKINRYFFLGDEACKKDFGFFAGLCIQARGKLIVPSSIFGELGGP